jgi:gliding motility-associated-like protein
MKLRILLLICFATTWLAKGQGWVHNGAHVVATNGTFIVISGTKGNYKAQGVSRLIFNGDVEMSFTANWINNSNGAVFMTNDGRVVLKGAAQFFQGTNTTAFPSLDLKCSVNPTMQTNILVGGGHKSGGIGKLNLFDRQLILNGRKLIINNRSETAISKTTGGILSETFPTFGYGFIQWNLRDAGAGPQYRIPFQTATGSDIPFDYNVKNVGLQTTDSGFVTIATYPTPTVSLPNNRPLPFGVPHVKNEFGTENARRMLDRFWVIQDGGYNSKPEISLGFSYLDPEHNTGTNTIQESNMGAISWSAIGNKWNYPVRSRVIAGNNTLLLHAGVNFSGIWTLSDTTPCPIANFSNTGSCEKDSVLFIDKSTVAQDTLIRWSWSYGNGNTGSGDSAVGYFSPAGIYSTRLIVTAANGCRDTIDKKINILGAPQANYLVEDTCENTIVKFTSLTSPGSGFIAKEYWWFGDGSTYTGKSPQHYYGTSGIPQVKYIVYNSNLCKDTIDRTIYIANKPFVYYSVKPDCEDVNFPFTNASTAGAGTIQSYNWDFGNGRRSTLRDENIVFPDSGTYPVRLIVTNSFGCRDTFQQPLRVYPRAIASFKYNPFDPQMLKPVTFTNLSTIDTKWTWDFGDGYYDIIENPVHSYNMYGTYNVSLIADNDYGCADTTSLSLRAKSIPLYYFPTAFTPANTEGLNDKFGLFSPLTVTNYRMMIFNRYGEIIFETTDQTKLWDGRVNNELVMGGVYIYDATFKNPENEIQRYSGNVTLLR